MIEYIVALIIVMVAFIGWLQLTSNAVRQNAYANKLAIAGNLAYSKASELYALTPTMLTQWASGQTQAGTIAPNLPDNCCYEVLNQAGEVIPPVGSSSPQPKDRVPAFYRQWLIIKDNPNPGDATIAVTVVYENFAGKTMRIAKLIRPDLPNTN